MPWYFHRKTSATLWDRYPWPWHGQHHITQVPPIFIHLFGGHGSRLPSFPESWWVSSRLVVTWMFLVDTHWWPIWIGQEVTLLLKKFNWWPFKWSRCESIDSDGATFSKENQGSSQEISRTHQQKSHLHTYHSSFHSMKKTSLQSLWSQTKSPGTGLNGMEPLSRTATALFQAKPQSCRRSEPCVFAGVLLKNKKVMSSSLAVLGTI